MGARLAMSKANATGICWPWAMKRKISIPEYGEKMVLAVFFRDRKIDWHKGGRKGSSGTKEPTGNMLSSQIACVNFLLPLVAVNGALDAIARAIDDDVEGIVNIRDEDKSSPIEFEWIGLGNSLEGKDTRGSNTTSVDAFMIARTKASHLRAYLMEWKYTESYTVGKYKGTGKSGEVIWQRYASLYSAESSSFGTAKGAVPMNEFFYDPFHQIMRNRLLADRMVHASELDVAEAKVVVVVPEENTQYRERITSPPLYTRFSDLKTVDEVVRETLKDPDSAFKTVSPAKLVRAVEDKCGATAADWISYVRDRYAF